MGRDKGCGVINAVILAGTVSLAIVGLMALIMLGHEIWRGIVGVLEHLGLISRENLGKRE